MYSYFEIKRKGFMRGADPSYMVISAPLVMRMIPIGMAIAVD